MLTSSHKNEIKVTLNADTSKPSFKESNIGASFWSLSTELFREIDEGFLATNVIKIRLYEEKGGEYKNFEPSLDSSDGIQITFPLRITPPEENLRNKLKCLRFSLKGEKYQVEESYIVDLKYNDLEKIFISCQYNKAQFKKDYFAVGYIGDEDAVKDFKYSKKEERFRAEHDEYQIVDFVPPKKGASAVTGISLIFLALFTNLE